MKPLISVIIPTHDRARRLEEALASVYAQQGTGVEFDMEVIVVDDASSDNTVEVVANHPGVRYIRLPTNRGLAAARNAGVRVSSGEFVAFLDDDDIWLPHKLKQQNAELEKHPEAAAVYSPCVIRSQGRKVIPEKRRGPSGFVLNAFVKENFAPVHGYLLRRSAIARAGYFDEQLLCFEDWDLWVRIALHSPFIFLPGYVGVYRYSPHGMLGTAKAVGNDALAHRHMMEKLRDLLKDSTAPQKIVREARAWVELELAGHLMTEQITLVQSMRSIARCSFHLLAALRIFLFPDVMREAEARQKIASIVSGMFKSYLRIVLPPRLVTPGKRIRGMWRTPHHTAGRLVAKKKPLVSAIITSHNRATLLPEAVDSVYAQEDAGIGFDLEVIVVDDASTDSTPEVMRRYPEARYIRLPTNHGLPAARNAGIRASRGAYVAFLDDDDLWLPCKLRRQVPVLEARPDVAVVYSQHIIRNGNNEVAWPDRVPSGSVFRALLMDHRAATHVHCFLVRSGALEKVGYFDESLSSAEDYDVWLRLAFQFPFVFTPGAVAIYRSSPHGMFWTQVADGRAEQPVRRVYEKALAMLPESPAFAEMKQEARAHMELRIASQMCHAGELEQARTLTIVALQAFPDIVDDPSARALFTELASQFAMSRFIDFAWTFPAEFKAAICARSFSFQGHRRLSRLLSDLWAGIAIGLSVGPKADDRRAGLAALLAVLHDPSKVNRKSLLWRMGRAIIGGRQADSIIALIRRIGGRRG